MECGTFCHVTALGKAAGIDLVGLDPSTDESAVIRGPKRPTAVHLTPNAKLNTALQLTGDRVRDQQRLVVFTVAAALLAEKNCGPDFG
jgi:hypothetical protein